MCPGFICKGGMRKHYRKSLPWGIRGCTMTRSRLRTTDDRRKKTLAKRVFPDILLEAWISYFVFPCDTQAFASSIGDVDVRPAGESRSFFTRHLVPPCAQVCLTAVVKHFFSVSGSVSHPSSGRLRRTIWGKSLCGFGEFWWKGCSQALPWWWWWRQT